MPFEPGGWTAPDVRPSVSDWGSSWDGEMTRMSRSGVFGTMGRPGGLKEEESSEEDGMSRRGMLDLT